MRLKFGARTEFLSDTGIAVDAETAIIAGCSLALPFLTQRSLNHATSLYAIPWQGFALFWFLFGGLAIRRRISIGVPILLGFLLVELCHFAVDTPIKVSTGFVLSVLALVSVYKWFGSRGKGFVAMIIYTGYLVSAAIILT